MGCTIERNPASGGRGFAVSAIALFSFFGIWPAAFATFPGGNGHIAYALWDPSWLTSGSAQYTLYTTDGNQLTQPGSGEQHTSPAYSPDGKHIAFITGNTIDVMNADGSNRQAILRSDSLGPTPATFYSVTWLSNGHQLAVSAVILSGGSYASGGIWLVGADGSSPTQVIANGDAAEQTIFEVDGSPTNDSVVYRCRYRATSYKLRDDYCILDPTGGGQRLPIDWPSINFLCPPHYTPDGQSLIFVGEYTSPDQVPFSFTSAYYPASTISGTSAYQRTSVFKINVDGTGLTEITHPSYVTYGIETETQFSAGVEGDFNFTDALMSPDGESIIASGTKNYPNATAVFGIWSVAKNTGAVSLLRGFKQQLLIYTYPNWQPLPKALTIAMQDGHGHPLDGLKVELRRLDGTLVDDKPINSSNGRYVFDKSVAAGDYDVRAILTDNCQPAACVPAFDIRYAPEPADPVSMDFAITVTASNVFFPLNFAGDDPNLLGYNIASSAADRLDDMANIYFRMHQYVDWVKAHLIIDTGATAHYYTYATNDPFSGTLLKDRAYYIEGRDTIVIDSADSDYENRDGVLDPAHDDDGPENVEWHEYTHHLYFTFVSSSGCPNSVNHAGYNNPTTCDSLREGFAEFLPTVAAQDIDSRTDANYANIENLEVNSKAWTYRRSGETEEDYAVAALLWDLVDSAPDADPAIFIGADGQPHPVVYTDRVQMPLADLWKQMVVSHSATIADLHSSFGAQTPFFDLDGDGIADVSLIDVPFLMHGFFPVDTAAHKNVFFYDVGYAQRASAAAARDDAVSLSSHYVFNNAGGLNSALIPRNNSSLVPHSNLGITVLDASGSPLPGATLHLTYHYPNGLVDKVDRKLSEGVNNLVYVHLPAYFDYLLPDDASLPPCDPANDVYADVTFNVEAQGKVSNEAPVVDNCTYLHAIASASGPAALTYTLTVPVVGVTMYALALNTSGTGLGTTLGAGTYTSGQTVTVSATARAGSTFGGWIGPDAAECSTGTVVMTANKSCTAIMTAIVANVVSVPNVVGLTQAAASNAITGAGLTVGVMTTQDSTTVAAGNVISEGPLAGTRVTTQSPVNLVLAANRAICDPNGDARVDLRDILIITAALTKPSSGPFDPRDPDRNGTINARDVAKCISMCTRSFCALK
jgi:hypothetical protein